VLRDTGHCGHRNSGARETGRGEAAHIAVGAAAAHMFGVGGEVDEERMVGGEAVPFVATSVEKFDEDAFPDSRLSSALEALESGEVREAGEAPEPHSIATSVCSAQGSPS